MTYKCKSDIVSMNISVLFLNICNITDGLVIKIPTSIKMTVDIFSFSMTSY